ncbi:hypothetical protein [uncultured Roseovarius sp.]|uniref:hypothetical protein n=1 Tax=uncultured Roseovarius sp. TaxID=293344 RepID=UPI002601CE24|nr:hypothetical protein [uncultured Roseovarius sp.]
MKLLKKTALVCTTVLISLPAFAGESKLSDVDVVVDLSAFTDSNALTYWPELDKDLEAALSQHAMIEPISEAPRIRVEINKVAVDGDTILPDSGEFNQLEGTIAVYESLNADGANVKQTADDAPISSFPLRLTAQTADTANEEGWTVFIPPSKDDFYNALVNAYAERTLEKVAEK